MIDAFDRRQYYLKSFLGITAILTLVGVIMVYSSSYIYAKEVMGSSIYFFGRQLMFVLLGLGIVYVTYRTKFNFWIKYGVYIHFGVCLLLLLTFIPGIGISMKGANRWLNFGLFGLQPGELVKYTSILAAVTFFEKFGELDNKMKGVYTSAFLLSLMLLILQPDFGTFTICAVNLTFVAFMSSFPRKLFYGLTGAGFIAAVIILISAPYRVKRLLTFLDPWKDPKNSGFQIIQSYLAFANGKIFGSGIGNSSEKLFYLPEAHNDFIFSVIGEELGFVGVTVIVIFFMLFIYWGMKLASHAKNRTVFLLITAVIFSIGFQGFLNMGVVLGLLPTKGLNLPFISYGGSSLIANFWAIGILLSSLKVMNHEDSFL